MSIRLRIDIGLGDVVTPAPVIATLPSILDDLPPPKVKVVPPETIVAVPPKRDSTVQVSLSVSTIGESPPDDDPLWRE